MSFVLPPDFAEDVVTRSALKPVVRRPSQNRAGAIHVTGNEKQISYYPLTNFKIRRFGVVDDLPDTSLMINTKNELIQVVMASGSASTTSGSVLIHSQKNL